MNNRRITVNMKNGKFYRIYVIVKDERRIKRNMYKEG